MLQSGKAQVWSRPLLIALTFTFLTVAGCFKSTSPEPGSGGGGMESRGAGGSGGSAGGAGSSSSGGGSATGGSASNGGGQMGGGSEPISHQQWSSGSRLKATVISDGAGGAHLLHWYDTQLQTTCLFARSADGELRCIPWLASTSVGETVSNFVDENCTKPAALAAGCSPKYAMRPQTNVCPQRNHLFTLGSPVGSTYYFKSGSTCYKQVTSAFTVYPLGEELNPDTFVSATLTLGTGNGVALNRITASDGASGTSDLRDVSAGFDGWEFTFRDGSFRCVPQQTAFEGTSFSDAACSTPAYLIQPPCPAPAYTVKWGSGGGACEIEPKYGRLGSPISTYYSLGGCTAMTSSNQMQAYAAGEALTSNAFRAGTPTTTSLGRLERRVLTWPGGLKTLSGWRDTQLDAECYTSYSASDGSRRCIPYTPGANTGSYFADAACTQPLASVQHDCTPKFAIEYSDNCQLRARSFRVGTRHTGLVYSRLANLFCMPTISPYVMFFTTGEVQPSEMAPLIEETR